MNTTPIKFPGTFIILPVALLLFSGCSKRAPVIGAAAEVSNGVRITISSSPDPPVTGINTIIVQLADAATGAAVVDANVTISTYNKLAGGGDQQTARSQGNGQYQAPVRFPIPDTYDLAVTVQQIGKQDADTTREITCQ